MMMMMILIPGRYL